MKGLKGEPTSLCRFRRLLFFFLIFLKSESSDQTVVQYHVTVSQCGLAARKIIDVIPQVKLCSALSANQRPPLWRGSSYVNLGAKSFQVCLSLNACMDPIPCMRTLLLTLAQKISVQLLVSKTDGSTYEPPASLPICQCRRSAPAPTHRTCSTT